MPEMRNQTIRAGMGSNVPGGLWIRRGLSPTTAAAGRRGILRGTADNKENVMPPGALTRRRHSVKSPLPAWYPRTPLRDITIIVNAIQRTRMRTRAARRRQQSQEPTAASPETGLLTSSVALVADRTPPSQALPLDVSGTSSNRTETSLSPVSSIGERQEISSPDSFFPPEQTPTAVAASIDSQPKSPESSEYEKKLGSSIDEIEKVVMENLKKTPKVPPRKATRALMSMR